MDKTWNLTFEHMKIVVLDGYGLNPGDLSWEEMRALGELTVYDRTAPAELLERSAGAEVLITNKTVITAEDMAALPALKYIGVLATGYNIVDIQAAKARGIIVTNIPAYSTASVAQMVFAHILNITQRVGHYAYANRHGRWADNPDFCYWDTDLVELDGKKPDRRRRASLPLSECRYAPILPSRSHNFPEESGKWSWMSCSANVTW